MKDIMNNELSVGDRVVFVHGKNSDAELKVGNVTKFYKGYWKDEECSVDNYTHVKSFRIMKLNDTEGIKNEG